MSIIDLTEISSANEETNMDNLGSLLLATVSSEIHQKSYTFEISAQTDMDYFTKDGSTLQYNRRD
jgi:hypothetical protein